MSPGAVVSLSLLAAHPALTVYFQSNFSDAGYQKKVFDKVGKAFVQPRAADCPKPGKKAVVQTVIASDGKLVSAAVSFESGAKAWDAAALAAVKRAAPFAPLPRGFFAPSVQAHFHIAWEP